MKHISLSPSQIILLSYMTLVTICTALLLLPIAHTTPLPFIDILFTAVSTATGAGALTVSLNNFTHFGILIITIFMQLSALGFLGTILYILYLFFHNNDSMTLLAKDLLGLKSREDIHTFTKYIICATLFFESIGAFILFLSFQHDYDAPHALFMAIFHSISAFTNTGFALFGDSIAPYAGNPRVLATLSCLMLAGCLGFVVMRDLHHTLRNYLKDKRARLSLSSIITLRTIISLVTFGSIMFWLLKYDHIHTFPDTFTAAINTVFNTISALGTGFATVSTQTLSNPMLLLIIMLTLVGSSPGSAGSGLQTTTVALFLSTTLAALRGKKQVTIHGEPIANDQVYKAVTIVSLSLLWIFVSTFVLSITEPDSQFISLLFESVSSFSTLGMTTNLTPHLSTLGKIMVMLNFTAGKIGSITFIFAIRNTIKPDKTQSKERVLLS